MNWIEFCGIVLFLMFCHVLAYCYEIRTVDGKGEIKKYDKAWNDAEKNLVVNCSSCTNGETTFILVSVPAIDKEIIDDLNAEDKIYSKSNFKAELDKRKSTKYNLEKMFEANQRIIYFKSISVSTATYQDDFNKHKDRYDKVK
mgnify:CR=1 FL=1